MEQELKVKTNAVADNLTTLTQTNADLTVSVQFDNELVNVGTEAVPLQDPNLTQVELLEKRKLKNSIEGIECELLVNQSVDTILEVDVDGNLYITDQQDQVENFEIDNNAELIYTFTD